MSSSLATHYRICPLCEATCGLQIHVAERVVLSVRGDDEDVFSHGYICPKGVALKELDGDPDRLRQPLVRRGGKHVPVSWDEAFAEIERRLTPIAAAHGRDAVALYLGNPGAHKASIGLYTRALIRALGSRNLYSASTLDQAPKQLAAGLMFGDWLSVPIPDVDRCDHFLVLGANPVASNGSLFTVPNVRARLRALRKRGGRLVVVDPRRSATAEIADRHVFIRPGTDAHLLIGVAATLFEEELVRLGSLAEHVAGLEAVEQAVRAFPPERVAPVCGIPAAEIRGLARELAAAPRAAVYGRIGTCTQAYGTVASWLVDVLNVLTGNLDRPGGVLFPRPPAFAANTRGEPGRGRGIRFGRRQSRVRGAPEVMGELPTACLAEEIDTPGEGQVRALVTVAGNPALSAPNSQRLTAALAQLEFMVSVDVYLNETTRHADVILPGVSPLEEGHFDFVFGSFAVRNTARASPPIFPLAAGRPAEWEVLLRLAAIAGGAGAGADVANLDDAMIAQEVKRLTEDPWSPIHGRDPGEIFAELAPRRGPERQFDLALRVGPYGDGFGKEPAGLTLAKLEERPHGVDLGPLQPRLPEVLRTPSGKVELAPEVVLRDLERLQASLEMDADGSLLLVGRRHLQSNNSWMHNLPVLARGPFRCTLHVHPDDATRLGLAHGQQARVRGRVGEVVAQVEVTDTVMPGVVSLPHGWGHEQPGTWMRVAKKRPGANSNVLADETQVDPVSGNAVLNGIPVTVEAA